mgnify:CR=1 FL=1
MFLPLCVVAGWLDRSGPVIAVEQQTEKEEEEEEEEEEPL